jgi:hypothetical protein
MCVTVACLGLITKGGEGARELTLPLEVCGINSLQTQHVPLTALLQQLLLVLLRALPQSLLTVAAVCGFGSLLTQHAPPAAQQGMQVLLLVLQEVQAQLLQAAAA